MPPQVQKPHQTPQMQSVTQSPFQPLPQLDHLTSWQHQHQPTNFSSLNHHASPGISSPDVQTLIPKSPSQADLSLVLSSTGNSRSTSLKTKGTRSPDPSKQSSLLSNTNSSCKSSQIIKKGSGVDMKGPTPEVAQQLRFPWKLHLLLERCEYEHRQKIAAYQVEGKNPASLPDMPISWLPCGKAFKVHDKERFVREIMPSFFGTQSFKTFQRNLNLWGFTRVSKGPQKDVCSHPLFLKGFPAVCQSMKRIVLKGTGRGNRAPLGGVDVSSVQAVVAAAAMQQAQQQAQQQQTVQQHASGMGGINNNGGSINQMPHHIREQVLQQQQQLQTHHTKNSDVIGLTQQNQMASAHNQNPNQQASQNQQQQFLIENGSIVQAAMPSQQKLVILPTPVNPNASATTTVMWPNNVNQSLQEPQQLQQQQTLDLQKSLQQLGAIIQQMSEKNNALPAVTVSSNSVNNSISSSNLNTANFQQQQQPQLQVNSTSMPNIIQQQQQPPNPSSVVAPSPMSTQDLVSLLLQRNLQQQVCQVQASTNHQPQAQVQLQIPSSLFPIGLTPASQTLQQQPQQQQAQQPLVMNVTGTNLFSQSSSSGSFSQQQQGSGIMGNNTNVFQQQPQNAVMTSPLPNCSMNPHQQQNQLLQLLLQQNGWSTSSTA